MNCPRKPLSRSDHARLCDVAGRLARKYPPDWLERRRSQLYAWTLISCFLLGYLCAVVWSTWWAYLIPAVGPLLISGVIPLCVFGREPGRPRWAHPKAVVGDEDVAMIGVLVDAMDDPLRIKLARHCPATDGAKFFRIWQALRHAGPEEPR